NGDQEVRGDDDRAGRPRAGPQRRRAAGRGVAELALPELGQGAEGVTTKKKADPDATCANCGAPAEFVTTNVGQVPVTFCRICASVVYPDPEGRLEEIS